MSERTVEEWFAAGQRLPVTVRSGTHHLFVRRRGLVGPHVTLVHGFPTCSFDFAAVSELLDGERRLLLFDLLGFGDSDKPQSHRYSLVEQADLVEALWRVEGVTATSLVAHDYGVSVAQELLARRREGRLAVALESVVFLNGGLYPDLHRALLVQSLLAHRIVGPLLTHLIDERTFRRTFSSVFAAAHRPGAEELHQHWLAIARRDGTRNYHRLIGYIAERRLYRHRWQQALEDPGAPPRAFIWGMRDPVSGAHVAQHLAERLPDAPRVELADVGHYPHLEAFDEVAAHLRQHLPA